jgi:hypothetical protein
MRYVVLALLIACLAVSLFVALAMTGGAIWSFSTLIACAWVAFPLLTAVAANLCQIAELIDSLAVPIAGVLVGVITVPVYINAYTYDGADGQVALVFAVFPIYQAIGLGFFGLFGYLFGRVFFDRSDSPGEGQDALAEQGQ